MAGTLRHAVYEIVEPGVRPSARASLLEWLCVLAILASVTYTVAATMASVEAADARALVAVE